MLISEHAERGSHRSTLLEIDRTSSSVFGGGGGSSDESMIPCLVLCPWEVRPHHH